MLDFIAAVMSAAVLTVAAPAQEITWTVPEDGGTPRDTNRIERLGPREFRIHAVFQEGGESALRHAVSRLDLVCHNDADRAVRVTLHLDLSDDGKPNPSRA